MQAARSIDPKSSDLESAFARLRARGPVCLARVSFRHLVLQLTLDGLRDMLVHIRSKYGPHLESNRMDQLRKGATLTKCTRFTVRGVRGLLLLCRRI